MSLDQLVIERMQKRKQLALNGAPPFQVTLDGVQLLDAYLALEAQRDALRAALELLSGMKLGMVADRIVDKALAQCQREPT